MQTGRSIAAMARAAIAVLLAASLLPEASAAEPLVLAQGAGFEKLPDIVAPTPYSPTSPPSSPPAVAPGQSPANSGHPDRSTSSSSEVYWGAIAFTADGSYSSAWKMPSQPEAEARALKQCARFGRGGCEVVSFSGQECAALATFIGAYRRRRWNLSFTAGGMTYPAAQGAALNRCNSDERTQGHCQLRTAACADGR